METKIAIDSLIIMKYPFFEKSWEREVLDYAISALEKVETLEAENARLREKEVPKEPRYVKEGYAYCPNCGDNVNEWLEYQNEFISYKFCSNCGQAIKIDKE